MLKPGNQSSQICSLSDEKQFCPIQKSLNKNTNLLLFIKFLFKLFVFGKWFLKYDVLYSITTYSLMHRNEKNTFKVTLLLNTFNSFKLKKQHFISNYY